MSERSLIELARATALSVDALDLANSPEHARYFVAGYDLGFASAKNDDALVLANERIADLEAQLAAAQTPAAPVVGVVVTEEMVRRAWRFMPFAEKHAVRAALTAALTTATTVPLSSAEPVMYETATRGTTDMQTPLYRGISERAQRGEG